MGQRVAVGDVIAGKYRVERVLGSGGMGVVVAVRHTQLDVLYAVKFMSDEALEDPTLVSRFLREARAAARLRGEHIARVTDVGVLESGAPFQVIEYLEGRDLAAVLAASGPLPVGRAVALILQACDGLDEAHRAGIVHRDIKPSNLFLTERPNGTACVKVLDFGISKSETIGRSFGKLAASTGSELLLGSPSYMAPEQMRAASDVDARADVWGLGATLYELLTGRLPFEGKTLFDLAPIASARADVSPELEAVVLGCMAKRPEDRFPDMRSLASALSPYAWPVEPAPPRRRWRGVYSMAGACLVGVLLGVALLFMRQDPEPRVLSVTAASWSDAGHVRHAEPAIAAAREPASTASAEREPQIPTWQIADLPTAPPPPTLVAPPSPQPAPSSSAARAPAPSAAAQPDCAHPTYLDEHGRVKFKEECLDMPGPQAPDAGAVRPGIPL
jgi:serine/threonine-protein kinase